jgi:sec-independent protein translocase protein TatB
MFDIGSGELIVIGVVALVAIGPKELPGVLRMVGQWVAKARRMASEFQSQFHEAMREAEMADIKKSFDEVSDAARGMTGANLLGTAAKDIEDAVKGDEPKAGTDASGGGASAAPLAADGPSVEAPAAHETSAPAATPAAAMQDPAEGKSGT